MYLSLFRLVVPIREESDVNLVAAVRTQWRSRELLACDRTSLQWMCCTSNCTKSWQMFCQALYHCEGKVCPWFNQFSCRRLKWCLSILGTPENTFMVRDSAGWTGERNGARCKGKAHVTAHKYLCPVIFSYLKRQGRRFFPQPSFVLKHRLGMYTYAWPDYAIKFKLKMDTILHEHWRTKKSATTAGCGEFRSIHEDTSV